MNNHKLRSQGKLNNIISAGLLLITLIFLPFNSHADDAPVGAPSKNLQEILSSLKYQTGEIKLKGGLATLNMPTNLTFLDSKDAATVLVTLWGNPPEAGKVLGMIMPAGVSPTNDQSWAVTVTYGEEGFVKDDDAAKINYDALLKQMQKGVAEASKERVKDGYDSIALIGWAAPPHYDAATHKLYWAKELQFGGSENHTLNYCIRILGRRGVLELNAIASLEQLHGIEQEIPTILSVVNFNDGNRYSDFDPKIDKVATYGIAALVAGGVAAKLGFFKLLLVGLLAAKKFLILAFIAVAGFFKKMFGGRKNQTAAQSDSSGNLPPPQPPEL